MKLKSQSGSVLLSTLSFIILLAVAAASILELTMNSYKLTMRNEMRAQARSVAESELENIYFQWVTKIMSSVPASDTPSALSAIADTPAPTDPQFPTTDRLPFLAAHHSQGWVVRRSIGYDPTYDYFDGAIPGSNPPKLGKVTYVTVRIEVLPNSSSYFHNEVSVRVGRRFATTNTSIFQYGIFYQGDLEMAPGNDITIDGDVVANGSIYMAASNPGHLTLNRNVRYLNGDNFNSYVDADSNLIASLRKPNTPVGGALNAPIFGTSQASQVSPMNEPENLLGGIDATEVVARRPDLFPTENDVYRAAIVPPPSDTDEYPPGDDDPTIAVTRMYNRAGLRITVNTDGTVVFIKPGIDPAHDTDVTADYAGVVTGTPNTDFYDLREGTNVKMTTIDMGALMTAVQANYTPGSSDFNGAVYVNVKGSGATTPRAVKLINGSNVYGRRELGTTVTTNGGLYVQGSYNNTSHTLPDGSSNPAMLMADQITVLSDAWDDHNAVAGSPLSDRVASGNININAGILTGNTSATSSQASGGAQNLVRYLENWNGYNVNVLGSLGRLFESKTFHSWFQQPGTVYGKPTARNFVFDQSLLKHPPAGSPTTTAFSRGSFFVW